MNLLTRTWGSLTGDPAVEVARLRKRALAINALESSLTDISDAELKAQSDDLRKTIQSDGITSDLEARAFALVRESAKRTLGQRHYDVQLIGGFVLHHGKVAEMKTGEGKTLVASLALYLNALSGKGSHLVTTNDYLAKTGAGWMAPIYTLLGVSVSYISHDASFIWDPTYTLEGVVDERHRHWRAASRREAYLADITYGQNSEFGFDYLRDNMATGLDSFVQRGLHFAIVDEADSILIDEARTPLIISAPAEEPAQTYKQFARVVKKLANESDYVIEEKHRAVTLTEAGVTRVEGLLGIANLYEGDTSHLRYLDNALKAHTLYRLDHEYVVKDGKVVIVDEFTGRLMPGRRWSDGLHQAIEAKEGVEIERETKTWATITLQNYFRMYQKLSGMTGTAATEADEFFKVYQMEVIPVPTHRPLIRLDESDLVFRTKAGKLAALVEEVARAHALGQPLLVGTTSVANNEELSVLLKRRGIKHEVLNAKNHEREAAIIAAAGQAYGVTVATNLAGRGVDILLGEGVGALGGLRVLGTERHDARRIDNQLRGRSGRQGDPGSSRFYLSLDDDLLRIFGDNLPNLLDRLGFDDSLPIESRMVSRVIEQAQIKVEGLNFDVRKRTLDYDGVLNFQRNVIYTERRKILLGADVREDIIEYAVLLALSFIDEHASGEVEDWQLDKLRAALSGLLALPASEVLPTAESFKDLSELEDAVEAQINATYELRETQMGSEVFRQAERFVFLRAIDEHWVEHLTHMEALREGIHLRGYGQQDPLIAYKGEASSLYAAMNEAVRAHVAQSIFHVSIGVTPEEEAASTPSPTSAASVTAVAPMGRNQLCACNSGKKYKKCHGK